jgi:hypothetical protein
MMAAVIAIRFLFMPKLHLAIAPMSSKEEFEGIVSHRPV